MVVRMCMCRVCVCEGERASVRTREGAVYVKHICPALMSMHSGTLNTHGHDPSTILRIRLAAYVENDQMSECVLVPVRIPTQYTHTRSRTHIRYVRAHMKIVCASFFSFVQYTHSGQMQSNVVVLFMVKTVDRQTERKLKCLFHSELCERNVINRASCDLLIYISA